MTKKRSPAQLAQRYAFQLHDVALSLYSQARYTYRDAKRAVRADERFRTKRKGTAFGPMEDWKTMADLARNTEKLAQEATKLAQQARAQARLAIKALK